jgi:radical SAM protein with 4Fe4S-binding SPASM domain
MTEADVARMQRNLEALSKRYNQRIILQKQFPHENYTNDYREAAKEQNLTGCPCGEFSCFVWPNGYVTWCPYSTAEFFVIGDIGPKGRLAEVWNNKKVQSQKQYRIDNINSACRQCQALRYCKGGCPVDAYNITGSVLSKDPYCRIK